VEGVEASKEEGEEEDDEGAKDRGGRRVVGRDKCRTSCPRRRKRAMACPPVWCGDGGREIVVVGLARRRLALLLLRCRPASSRRANNLICFLF